MSSRLCYVMEGGYDDEIKHAIELSAAVYNDDLASDIQLTDALQESLGISLPETSSSSHASEGPADDFIDNYVIQKISGEAGDCGFRFFKCAREIFIQYALDHLDQPLSYYHGNALIKKSIGELIQDDMANNAAIYMDVLDAFGNTGFAKAIKYAMSRFGGDPYIPGAEDIQQYLNHYYIERSTPQNGHLSTLLLPVIAAATNTNFIMFNEQNDGRLKVLFATNEVGRNGLIYGYHPYNKYEGRNEEHFDALYPKAILGGNVSCFDKERISVIKDLLADHIEEGDLINIMGYTPDEIAFAKVAM